MERVAIEKQDMKDADKENEVVATDPSTNTTPRLKFNKTKLLQAKKDS